MRSTKAEACALVIFGGSGDLARRKLIPALYNLARDGGLPAGVAIIGVGLDPWTTDVFRATHKEKTGKFSRTKPLDDKVVGELRRAAPLPLGRPRERRDLRGDRRAPRRARQEVRHAREPHLLLRRPGERLPDDPERPREVEAPQDGGRSGGAPLLARRGREALRERPRVGAEPEQARRGVDRRDAALPDRPLPRQRDRPEHVGVPVRQRDLRAALEPEVHRPRPGHGRRGHRASRAAGSSTTRRA